MSWQQICLDVDGSKEQAVSDLLTELGAVAVTTTSDEELWLEAGMPGRPEWNSVRVTGLFGADVDCAALVSELNRVFGDTASYSSLQDRDWEREYLAHFDVLHVGHELAVVPSFATREVDARVQLKLDPGLAFGTGSHATTAMCLDWLSRHSLAGKRVLDIGCGSGILAIAALLLGAAEAEGTDLDPKAIGAAEQNARDNAVESRLRVSLTADPSMLEPGDIVIANILAGTLIEMADSLAGLLKPGGHLLLSGILASQAPDVIAAFGNRANFATWRRGDWMLLFTPWHA